MEWTKDKPTKEGWYWLSQHDWRGNKMKNVVVGVSDWLGSLTVFFPGSEVTEELSDDNYFKDSYWIGPLSEPESPEA